MDLKKLFRQNKRHVKPLLDVAQRCVDDVVGMRANPSLVDYTKLAFSIKSNIETAYGRKDPYTYFSFRDQWQAFDTSHGLKIAICNLLRNYPGFQVNQIAATDSVSGYVIDIEDIRCGWICYDEDMEEMFISANATEKFEKIVSHVFWDTFSSGNAVFGMSDPKVVYFQDDARGTQFFDTPHAQTFANEIKEYTDQGIFRSILFYGPPGSGKSNLVKSIASRLKLKTLRINNLSDLSGQSIADGVRLLNPDAVILEDIDSVNVKELFDLLDKLETINKQKVTFATANAASTLDNALLRPGRFDEVIPIVQLDESVVLRLVNNDEELYNIVKEFPAAFITEFMKRVKVKGREHALANIKDLTDRLENIDKCNYELTRNSENGS